MRKADSDKVVAILIVALLLTAVFIYGGKQFANSVFKTECTFNKAFSLVYIRIDATYNGKNVRPQYLLVEDANRQAAKGRRFYFRRFGSSFFRVVRARFLRIRVSDMYKDEVPESKYGFIPNRYEITVISPKESLIGTKVVSIIPNKPFLTKTVHVKMEKVRADVTKYPLVNPALFAGNRSVVEECEGPKYVLTKIANIHSVKGEMTQAIFNMGCVAYVQSVFRAGRNALPEGGWKDAEPVAAYGGTNFATGYCKNGQSRTVFGGVGYVYTKEKIVMETLRAQYVYYKETVIPDKIMGSTSKNSLFSPPKEISGNKLCFTPLAGDSHDFVMKGIDEYYFIPAAKIDFGNGIKVSVSSERRYGQDFVIRVMTLRDDRGDLICGFDNGTNWGELYLQTGK